MTKAAITALLLSVAVAGTSASNAGTDAAVHQAIAELQAAIDNQKARIKVLQAENEAADSAGRHLADETSSIFSDLAGTKPYTTQESLGIAMDHLWLILCGALVMFMQAGFACVEAGSCRFKNVQSILLKNLLDVCFGTVGWWAFGWSFAYSGPSGAKFAGNEQFFGHAFMSTTADGRIEPTVASRDWFFQWAFCTAAATIVSGGVAERMNFGGYLIFSVCMSSFIYPIVVAWTWGGGFLAQMNTVGAFDFAGSGIVHMTGGVGSLVGAMIAGPRLGRFVGESGPLDAKARMMEVPKEFEQHNMALVTYGTFALWFGWYGFNCGSTLGMSTIEAGFIAAQVAMNTTIAATTGGLVVFALRYAMTRKLDVGGFCNGILAGLVSITAGCSNMETASAFATAFVGAVMFQAASLGLRAAKIDDPVDAFAVHGVCGAWGVLAAAFFDWGQGFHYVHGANAFKCISDSSGNCVRGLGAQIIGAAFAEIACICLWVAALTGIIFGSLKFAGLLVAPANIQEEGFDMFKAYEKREIEVEVPHTSI